MQNARNKLCMKENVCFFPKYPRYLTRLLSYWPFPAEQKNVYGNHRTERPPDPILYGCRPSGGFVNSAVTGIVYLSPRTLPPNTMLFCGQRCPHGIEKIEVSMSSRTRKIQLDSGLVTKIVFLYLVTRNCFPAFFLYCF